eukprot:TRINITY_DN2686_c0_g1_i1.p1 TRINITY_DN2686_c0_g1~~TRINITY_DN2686_c0_g1_i1.p1  ORF type:complete len:263 (-),score=86.43 TRINITY_DN2686_c0_g1_i1:1315-2103(-)
MARGPIKHLKRIHTPRSWMLDKTGGNFAVRPSQGPHKLRESIPLHIVLRHRLKLALNGFEVTKIVHDKEGGVRIDGKLRRDHKFPCGLMDVITLDKAEKSYRVLYDAKGRFVLRAVKGEEAKFKLCKVVRREVGPNKVPYVVTSDARTLRFPHPDVQVNDTVKVNLEEGKIVDYVKFDQGNLVIITGGNNLGRIGIIQHRERHLGGFDIVHIKDAHDRTFATRIGNVFVIGRGKKSWISLPKDEGIWLSALEEQDARREHHK